MHDRKTITGIAAVAAVAVVGGFFLLSGDRAPGELETAEFPAPDALPGREEMVVEKSAEPQKKTTEGAMVKERKETTVVYTEDGFTPATVEVRKGDTIRFENRSNRDMWPASAFHPTHTIYPEKSASDCLGSSFDACRGVPPGESWSFTFNSVGTWRYHDHLSAAKTGTVVVE